MAKLVLQFNEPSSIESFNVEMGKENSSLMVYNNATDATAWCIEISLSDFDRIKDFINQQLIKPNGN